MKNIWLKMNVEKFCFDVVTDNSNFDNSERMQS